MGSRRTSILIGALVLGGVAAFLTVNYVRGVERDTAAQNQLVDVLVATGPVQEGTSADEAIASGLLAPGERRRADLPAAAVVRTAEVAGQVATAELGGGEIITTTMFAAEADLSGSKSTILDKGNVAITISLDEAASVAGMLQRGDSVNILANVSADPAAQAGLSKGAVPAGGADYRMAAPSVFVLQDVKVLAVGQQLGGAPAEGEEQATTGSASGLITLQLPPDQAALLASVRNESLHLTLNRPDYEPVSVPFSATLPTFPGERGVSSSAERAGGNG